VPFYPDDKVKVSILPTDRSERDERTGMVLAIGFSPLRGSGVLQQSGFGYMQTVTQQLPRLEQFASPSDVQFLMSTPQGEVGWGGIRVENFKTIPLLPLIFPLQSVTDLPIEFARLVVPAGKPVLKVRVVAMYPPTATVYITFGRTLTGHWTGGYVEPNEDFIIGGGNEVKFFVTGTDMSTPYGVWMLVHFTERSG
jgi:hypothetical protein